MDVAKKKMYGEEKYALMDTSYVPPARLLVPHVRCAESL
jgi:hypothetical protein